MDILDYRKAYYLANRDKMVERSRQWRKDNSARVVARVDCDCGGRYLAPNKSNHLRTNKHQTWIEFQRQLNKKN